MDITIEVQDYVLNVRAAVVIVHNDRILVHKDINSDHYALMGGRVELGEDSITTIKREIKEEIGKEIEIIGYISTVENFFIMKGKKYHEIEFVYLAEFKDEKDKLIQDTIKNIEGKDYLQYEWIERNQIDKIPLMPVKIQEVLKDEKYPVHIINKDK